jgi:hypothetical protein
MPSPLCFHTGRCQSFRRFLSVFHSFHQRSTLAGLVPMGFKANSPPDYRSQVDQVSRSSPRPYSHPAHQGRDQDGRRHLPARVVDQGAQRSARVGRRTGRVGQGWKEGGAERQARRQGFDSSGMSTLKRGLWVSGNKGLRTKTRSGGGGYQKH